MTAVKVSQNFKTQAYKAIFSIILFIVVYLLLLLLAVGIAAGSCIAAFFMVTAAPSFITLMLGIGLVGIGGFIVYFMIKFLFAENKNDYSHMTEITRAEEPELFGMIQELVDTIGTDFPKKIYISPEVNASVFYDSSFWSMFFPVKKNLHIGLGLVNATTVSELKGILSHEFGHFSQKSMKVGSYVYNVNQIIYNLLYENSDYEKAMVSFANRSSYFAIMTYVAVWFTQLIQYLLKLMYRIVNVNYMALSREMEFHADEIAARNVGSGPMIDSMLRMDLVSSSFDRVINYYNAKIEKSVTVSNIFRQHQLSNQFIADSNKISIVNNLPNVNTDFNDRFNHSKLVIKNQWQSHPSTEERVHAFQRLDIDLGPYDNRLANVLFSNIDATQEKITKKMFASVAYPEDPTIEEPAHFLETIKKEYTENSYPKIYNSYYDNHPIDAMDLDSLMEEPETAITFEDLYSNGFTELVFILKSQENDLQLLQQITSKEFKIKTFDYEGKRYKASEAAKLAESLQQAISSNKEKLAENDRKAFRFFYQKAQQKNQQDRLAQLYRDLFTVSNQHEERAQMYMDMFHKFDFAYQQQEYDVIEKRMSNYYVFETRFKQIFKLLLEDELYKDAIDEEDKAKATAYLTADLVYFRNKRYDNEAIDTKNIATHLFLGVLQRAFFLRSKDILVFQATLI
ncbi:MAG: M48 family metallopeptidase [Flavobacterium sp.]